MIASLPFYPMRPAFGSGYQLLTKATHTSADWIKTKWQAKGGTR